MVRMARLALLLAAALLVAGTVVAAERLNFEDLLIDKEAHPKPPTDEQKQFEDAKGPFMAFLQSCNDKAYDKAGEQIKGVLMLNVSPDNALKLRDLASSRQIIAILADSPQIVKLRFQDFLAIAERGRRLWLKDQKRIDELVKQLVEGDFDQMWLAVYELTTAGQYAAPRLVEKLMDERDRQAKTRAAIALKTCGRSVTLPLAEALLGAPDQVKQEICFILRESPKGKMIIPDRRALPALKTIAQDEKVNLATRQEALKTIAIIETAPIAQLPSAQEIYFTEAEKFYHRDPSLLEPVYQDHIIWSWENNKLAARVVPEYAYYLEMAEKYCRQALAVDPAYEKVKPLLICSIYAQYNTALELLAVAERTPKNENITEQDVAGLKARKARLEEIINTLPSLGAKHYYAALQRALADQQAAIAVFCSDVLKELGSGTELAPSAVAKKP